MKAVKLISPLVALLLITVFFAGCITSTAATNVTTNSTLTGDPLTTPIISTSTSAASASQAATVGAGTIGTSINASVDKPYVNATEPFKITGRLNNSSTNQGIPNQTVNLDRWNGVTYVYTGVRTTTDADGNYTLIRSESVNGTYYYSSNFTGFANYNASHSSYVTVTVADRYPTTITLVVDHPNPFSGETFNFTGLLTNVTIGIPDVRVDLQSSLDNKTWSSASAPTKTANGTASGTFGFAGAVTGNGTVYFRAYYSGNFTYKPAYSPTVVVNVLKPATNMANFQVNNANPITNQAIYFAGHLKTNATATNPSKALAGELVYLEVSGEGVYWQQVSDPFVTDDSGLFAFTGALQTNGTFYFRAHFFGTDNARESASPIVTVKVTSSTATLPSKLSILASPPNPIEGQRVFIYGVVRSDETYPVAFADAKVYLYWSSDGNNWSPASSSPAVTNASGVYAFAGSLTKGTYYFRTYYGGSDKYQAAYSPTLQVVCTGTQPTTISLEASTTTPSVGGSVTFTATLSSDGAPLQDKPVTIYHYFNNVKYIDITTNTNAAGKITLTQPFSSTGQRTYYATFAGDSTLASATSSAVNVKVGIKPATLDLTASTTTPPAGGSVTFTATLSSDGAPLQDKPVTIYHYFNNVRYNDTTTNTNAAGKITLTQTLSSTGQRTYYATFAADGTYVSATSSVVTINVGITQIDIKASPTTTPTVGQSVTFTATLKSGDALLSGKSVTIYHYFNGVKYTDTTKTTTNGQITLTQSFSSTGQRTYYATFAGDTGYKASTSSVLAINVR